MIFSNTLYYGIKSNVLLFNGYGIYLAIQRELLYFISGYLYWNNMNMYFSTWIHGWQFLGLEDYGILIYGFMDDIWGIGRSASIFSMFVANDKLSDCCQASWWITFIWMENSYLNEWKKLFEWMDLMDGKRLTKKKDLMSEVRIINLRMKSVGWNRIYLLK